ncbi:MAG TPA: MFS transporter, partial [Acidimicrobiales bacterium]|nr:MFS transporter [Acidimicrobiales bacterium]
MQTAGQGHRPANPVAGVTRRGFAMARRHLVPLLGGPQRTRVVLVLACVLALSSADTATVGAAAVQLRRALHVGNTDIGLLVAVSAAVAAVFSLPFGVLADRVRRTYLLGLTVLAWTVAMVWSATAGSFSQLLYARVALGGVSAAAGPVTASLVGDWFLASERGQIYSYVLTGELLGAGVGFAITGDIAALSWRVAFVVLALPAFPLAWAVFHLPEPRRGGAGILPSLRPSNRRSTGAVADGAYVPGPTAQGATAEQATVPGLPPGLPPGAPPPPSAARKAEQHASQLTDAQQLVLERGIRPDPKLAARAKPGMGFLDAVRYVLAVRTNVALIVSGACGYYFLAGVETFGVEFVTRQYHVAQVVANLLLLLVGVGAVAGVAIAGPLGDRLLHRGRASGRVMVAAVSASAAVVLLVPAFLTHDALGALPYIGLAAGCLTAQNPPIDA